MSTQAANDSPETDPFFPGNTIADATRIIRAGGGFMSDESIIPFTGGWALSFLVRGKRVHHWRPAPDDTPMISGGERGIPFVSACHIFSIWAPRGGAMFGGGNYPRCRRCMRALRVRKDWARRWP